MRTSESPIVNSVMTSAMVRTSRAAATGALSRIDHETSAGDPGSSVTSTTVRPFAADRRVTRPRDRRTSAWSPGRSRVACAVPAEGTGSVNVARPGWKTSGAPQASVSPNGPDALDERRGAFAVDDQRQRPAAESGADRAVDERRSRQ